MIQNAGVRFPALERDEALGAAALFPREAAGADPSGAPPEESAAGCASLGSCRLPSVRRLGG